jgi:ABC-type branched-subunit amino acid transport system ATPase component
MKTKEEYLEEADKWLEKISLDNYNSSGCGALAQVAQAYIHMAEAIDNISHEIRIKEERYEKR